MAAQCGVYRISRIGTDQCYVGQSVDLWRRWGIHLALLHSNSHTNKYLQNVFNLVGRDGLFSEETRRKISETKRAAFMRRQLQEAA
jgi:GIY-YIG catalytic domain-containing protein